MAVAQDDLLAIACNRIRDLDRPACIKDSELRYVAVNRAYADFHGLGIDLFPGRKSGELNGGGIAADREITEWRALIYDIEETVACIDPVSGTAHPMLIERFLASDGSAHVFSMFVDEPAAEAGVETGEALVIDDGTVPLRVDEIRGARVLAVSENGRDRNLLADLLSRWGLDGCAVESGEIAFAVLEASFDLALPVDCLLIGDCADAADLIDRIRTDARLQALPIIAIGATGSGCLAVSTNLVRPVRADVLHAALADALAKTSDAPMPALEEKREGPEALDILVAEDNEVHQIVFARILEETGLNFTIVADGGEVVDIWERRRPRLILMDILLPTLSGFQAARRIREHERVSGDDVHVPIVGMTSYPPEVDRSLCLDAGMDDQLAKPVSPDALKAKIATWLDGVQEQRAGQAAG